MDTGDRSRPRKIPYRQKLIGKITLQRQDGHLWAETRENKAGLLEVDYQLGNTGAGRGIWKIPLRQLRLA